MIYNDQSHNSQLKNSMKKLLILTLTSIITLNVMAQQKIIQTAGRDALGDFAPEFAHLNDDILFGEVWSRNDLLSLRDRSLITVTCLVSQGLTDSSLTYHLQEQRKTESPAQKLPKLSPISPSMQVGRKRGRHSAWLKMCGKTRPKHPQLKKNSNRR